MNHNSMDQLKTLDLKEVIKILPHRYPFLLVDKVLNVDVEKGTILAQKNVTYNEAFFQGHFPGTPIMPGVLILEALAQAGGILFYLKGAHERIAVLLNINHAKFRNPVKPGDILLLNGECLHFSSKGGRIKVAATVNDKLAVEAEIGFALVDINNI